MHPLGFDYERWSVLVPAEWGPWLQRAGLSKAQAVRAGLELLRQEALADLEGEAK